MSPAQKRSKVGAEQARAFGRIGEIGPQFNLDAFHASIEKSCWVYAAVYRIAAALAATGCKVVETGTQNEAQGEDADAIRTVLRRVNPDQTRFDYFEAAFVYYGLDGEHYAEKARDGFGMTSEFHLLNPETVRPIPDPTGNRLISGYKVRVAGGGVVDLGPDDVVACRAFSPRTPWRGMSPMASVRTEVSADMAAAVYNLSQLRNGGRHGGLISPAEGDELDDAGYLRLEKQLRDRNWGPENVGRLMLLPAGFKFFPDGMNLKDMDFLQLRKFAREAISGVTGAVPILINNYDSATYANTEAQLKAFWDYTGKPMLLKLFGSYNEHWIHTEYGEHLSLEPDYVGIDALVDSEEKRIANAERMLGAGLITVNEARARIGYKPLPDGDKLMVQGAVVPMDVDDLTNPLAVPPAPARETISGGGEEDGDQEPSGAQLDDEPGLRAAAASFARRNGRLNGHDRNGHAKADADKIDREILKIAHLKSLEESERKFGRRVDGVLHRQQRKIVERAETMGEAVTAAELMPSVRGEATWMYGELAPALLEIVKDSGVRTLRRLGLAAEDDEERSFVPAAAEVHLKRRRRVTVSGTFDLGNSRIAEYLEKHFFSHLERENATTMARLEEVVNEFRAGARAGEGVGELVARIEKMAEFGGQRAEVIARTESIGAVNLGALEGFRATETPRKSWLSTRDGVRVRPSHASVDAETSAKPILTDERFTLVEPGRGSAQLLYPGDPNSPGWAAINCRCAMVPEEDEARSTWIEECKRELAEVHA